MGTDGRTGIQLHYITSLSLRVRRIQALARSSRRLSALRRNHSKKKHANAPATMRHITRTASTSAVLSTTKSSSTVITTTRRSSTADNSRPQRNTPYLRPVHKSCNFRHETFIFSILLTISPTSLSLLHYYSRHPATVTKKQFCRLLHTDTTSLTLYVEQVPQDTAQFEFYTSRN